jgi:hypothetical protein
MSEMTDVIASRTFLDVYMGIETLCADLYHFYSEVFEDIPEASRLWKKTALEEENHKRQFELALRLIILQVCRMPGDVYYGGPTWVATWTRIS